MSRKIAIIGLGLIGQSWAVDFARAGAKVMLWDNVEGVSDVAISKIKNLIKDLDSANLLDELPQAIEKRITVCRELHGALSNVEYVQENTPENLDIKHKVFAAIEANALPNAVIASSTSGLLPSDMFHGLVSAKRFLVAHPLNPPHLIPAVELVPGPATDTISLNTAHTILEETGHAVLKLNRETPGFVMNRLQGALLDEAFRLVDQGIIKPEDLDVAVREGLAVRWSVVGPFEAIDLNAPGGITDYIDRYGPMYDDLAIGSEGRADWNGSLREQLSVHRRAKLSLDQIPSRTQWRDAQLAEIALNRKSRKLKP